LSDAEIRTDVTTVSDLGGQLATCASAQAVVSS